MKPGYKARNFNGTTDYYSRASDLIGNADGKTGIFSAWVRIDGGATDYHYVIGSSGIRVGFRRDNSGAFRVLLKNAAGVMVGQVASVTPLAMNVWAHVLSSWDLSVAAIELYVNDVNVSQGITAVDDNIDYTQTEWCLGIDQGRYWPLNGAVSEVYFAPNQYLDFTVEANRRKFISATGRPVDLGITGEIPTGTAPIVYFPDCNALGNQGTGGDFTVGSGAPAEVEGPNPEPDGRPGFVATELDGTDNYIKTTDLAGNADAKTGIVSLWFRNDGNNGIYERILSSQGTNFSVQKLADNKLQVYGKNAAGGEILNLQSTVAYLKSATWYHLLASWDLATGTANMWVSDADKTNKVRADNDTIDYTRVGYGYGSASGGGDKFIGALSEVYFAPNQYIDITVEANRRKFISAEGTPVPLGTDGSTPTGTAPLVYLPDGDASDNKGTGGDFVAQGSPEEFSGPSPPVPGGRPGQVAMDLDGTSDYYNRASDLIGNADGKTGIVSAWVRIDGNDGASIYVLTNTSVRIILWRHSTNVFRVRGRNAASVDIMQMDTTTTHTAGPAWIHVLASWDLATAAGHLYIDDIDRKAAGATLVDDMIDYTWTSWGIGASSAGTNPHSGAISELYFAPNQYLDFSVEANRRKFISATKKPVNLGPDGSWPTGVAPLLYLPDGSGIYNRGSGGDFVKNGAPRKDTGPGGLNPNHKVRR